MNNDDEIIYFKRSHDEIRASIAAARKQLQTLMDYLGVPDPDCENYCQSN